MKYLPKIAKWLVDTQNARFLEDTLFEAISLSRRLSHYEYGDRVVSGLDATLDIEFLSPLPIQKESSSIDVGVVHLIFYLERHNPITLKYEVFGLERDTEEVALLTDDDYLHMEGPSYGDLEEIRVLVYKRLRELAQKAEEEKE
jgi:hypothetical protein